MYVKPYTLFGHSEPTGITVTSGRVSHMKALGMTKFVAYSGMKSWAQDNLPFIFVLRPLEQLAGAQGVRKIVHFVDKVLELMRGIEAADFKLDWSFAKVRVEYSFTMGRQTAAALKGLSRVVHLAGAEDFGLASLLGQESSCTSLFDDDFEELQGEQPLLDIKLIRVADWVGRVCEKAAALRALLSRARGRVRGDVVVALYELGRIVGFEHHFIERVLRDNQALREDTEELPPLRLLPGIGAGAAEAEAVMEHDAEVPIEVRERVEQLAAFLEEFSHVVPTSRGEPADEVELRAAALCEDPVRATQIVNNLYWDRRVIKRHNTLVVTDPRGKLRYQGRFTIAAKINIVNQIILERANTWEQELKLADE